MVARRRPPGTTVPATLDLLFEGRHRVRFIGTADKPEWVAQDVCDVLGITNARDAIADFDEDETGVATIYTSSGNRTMLTVYEPGLYKLIFKSRKDAAKKFRKWVFNEVLPSIRKFGVYPPPEDPIRAITLQPYTDRVIWGFQIRKQLAEGFWCVLLEGADILISAEHIFGPANLEMKEYDLLDGSIGKRWSMFRREQPWAGARLPYKHTFPRGDPRGTIRPWSYPMSELGHFSAWLHGTYWNQHFPAYIRNKYGESRLQKALPAFARLGITLGDSKQTDAE
jgi:prophage antirepressor-like protein